MNALIDKEWNMRILIHDSISSHITAIHGPMLMLKSADFILSSLKSPLICTQTFRSLFYNVAGQKFFSLCFKRFSFLVIIYSATYKRKQFQKVIFNAPIGAMMLSTSILQTQQTLTH